MSHETIVILTGRVWRLHWMIDHHSNERSRELAEEAFTELKDGRVGLAFKRIKEANILDKYWNPVEVAVKELWEEMG